MTISLRNDSKAEWKNAWENEIKLCLSLKNDQTIEETTVFFQKLLKIENTFPNLYLDDPLFDYTGKMLKKGYLNIQEMKLTLNSLTYTPPDNMCIPKEQAFSGLISQFVDNFGSSVVFFLLYHNKLTLALRYFYWDNSTGYSRAFGLGKENF